jgi:uncharacterized protein (TIGR01777 family)
MKGRVVIAGASGLIGNRLVPALQADGWEVARLVRRASRGAEEISWDPAAGELAPERIEGCAAVINLAGAGIGDGRWTEARRRLILRSRVDATRTLVSALARVERKPAVWINASAVGFYGDGGDTILTEASGIGQGFLPEVCLAWETHAEGAARLGVRTVLLRLGVVLAGEGGALAKMLPLFRKGLGGPVGSGRQWMSWIGIEDVLGVVLFALGEPRCAGPINVVAPEPVTNAAFAAALGRVLGRPAVLPAPAWALRLAYGRMADELLLAGTRAIPQRLTGIGYAFRQAELDGALRAAT